jgi:hypothetical protein
LVYLHGTTDYGDAIEDEWLIVYMLRQLSASHANLWIRMFDSDGEFLLVEAANVLPKWLSPEIDHNRVWIHNGKLLIVPHSQDDPAVPRNLSLPAAVNFIKQQPSSLIHSEFIEAEAFYRLEKYPGQIANSIHHSMLTIPRKLAFVLHSLPKAVAPGVEAFYVRDALALKPILSATATLTFPPEDTVAVSVRFSKVLFAQLRSQRFEPPPRWQSLMQKAKADSDHAYQSLEMGMKLTCGFEMLAASASKSNNRTVRELEIILEDLQEDGPEALPSDDEIRSWPNVERKDPEEWLDINYEDFERVLEGSSSGPAKPRFGDEKAQENLKKIVSRFEAFLNDDKAGIDGAEIDGMDVDDDTDDDFDSDETSNAEDKEVSFDEEEFAKMMREMMGLPSPGDASSSTMTGKGKEKAVTAQGEPKDAATTHAETDDDVEEIRKLTSQMEEELKGHGALKLGNKGKTGKQHKLKERSDTPEASGSRAEPVDSDEDEDEDVDIDYNLASNILESFKSQGGMSGPTGNLLGAMGFQLPRDEDDGDEQQGKQTRK